MSNKRILTVILGTGCLISCFCTPFLFKQEIVQKVLKQPKIISTIQPASYPQSDYVNVDSFIHLYHFFDLNEAEPTSKKINKILKFHHLIEPDKIVPEVLPMQETALPVVPIIPIKLKIKVTKAK